MRPPLRIVACSLLAFVIAPGLPVRAEDPIATVRVQAEFQDLRDRVIFAVEQQGLTVAHTARVGDMLARTGKDLGAKRTIADAEVIEFCSASLSLQLTEADPRYVAYCPYAITVYTLVAEPGAAYLVYRRPDASGASEAVARLLKRAETLLGDIVREAAD